MNSSKGVTLKGLQTFASDWLEQTSAHHILLLEGEMGAGKTQFCQLALKQLGIDEVTSPTFSLIQTYDTGERLIHHLDLFRLESEEELESTGFWDLLTEPAVILLEWGDRVDARDLNHPPWVVQRLVFEVEPGGTRKLTLTTL